jgi:hypothetical protein
MWVFYFFVHAQRFITFSPRLSLIPRKQDAAAVTPPLETAA